MDTLAALLSGFVAGAAVGVFGLGIFGSLLVTVPTTNWLRRQFPDPSNWLMVSLAAAFAAQAAVPCSDCCSAWRCSASATRSPAAWAAPPGASRPVW